LAWRHPRWNLRFVEHPKLIYAVAFILLIPAVYLAIWHPSPYDYMTTTWGLSCLDAFFAALLLLVLAVPHGLWAGFFRWSALGNIGGISYCIYVIHQAVNALCQAPFIPAHGEVPAAVSIGVTLLAIAITWTLAKISWRYLEGPFVRRAHSYRY